MLIGVLTAAASVRGAGAQERPNRISGPFSGLFGGARADNHQALDLRTSLFGVWQEVFVPADTDPALLDPRFQQSAAFAGVQSSLNYSFVRQDDNTNLNANAGAFISDFSVAPTLPQYGAFGGAGISTALTRRIRFQANGQSSYGSVFGFGGMAGGPIGVQGGFGPAAFDPNGLAATVGVPTLDIKNMLLWGSSNVTMAVSRRSNLAVDFQAQRTFFIGNPESDLATLSSGATYSHQVWRRLQLYGSYRRLQTIPVAEGQTATVSNWFDFGANYGDALTLQLSRRTTLAMTVGLGSGRGSTGGTRFTALGSAALTHTMARSWSAVLSASRNLGYVAGFEQQSVLQDLVSASLGGQLGRRATFSANAFFSRGYLGLDMSRYFDSYSATSGLSFALTRRVSAFTQVGYYGNLVPVGMSTLPFLPTFARGMATAGLSVWTPLYSNPRVRR